MGSLLPFEHLLVLTGSHPGPALFEHTIALPAMKHGGQGSDSWHEHPMSLWHPVLIGRGPGAFSNPAGLLQGLRVVVAVVSEHWTPSRTWAVFSTNGGPDTRASHLASAFLFCLAWSDRHHA